MSLRKLTKNSGLFPSDEALLKLFFLALRKISLKWSMPIRDWKTALTRFDIEFGDCLYDVWCSRYLHKIPDMTVPRQPLFLGGSPVCCVSTAPLRGEAEDCLNADESLFFSGVLLARRGLW